MRWGFPPVNACEVPLGAVASVKAFAMTASVPPARRHLLASAWADSHIRTPCLSRLLPVVTMIHPTVSRSDGSPLASAIAFAELDGEALAAIAAVATPVALEAGESLVRQGELGDALYVILTGTLDVVLELEGGARQNLAHLGPGDCVGELAFLTKRSRTATVVAREPASALRIAADALEEVLTDHPTARRQLVGFAMRRLPSLRLASTGLFVGVESSALERFDGESNWVRVRAKQTLFRQGESADAMYVVVYGSVEVVLERPDGRTRVVDVLGPGATVGEMALLTNEARSATVRAVRDSELVRLSKDEFFALLEEHPRTAVELARTLARRLRQTTAAPRTVRHTRVVALVPAQGSGLPAGFASQLAEALRSLGDTVFHLASDDVDAELGTGSAQTIFEDTSNDRLLNWLNEREERFRYVVYECDAALTPWTRRCLRQADLVLAVARADADAAPGEIERALCESEPSELSQSGASASRYELILLHAAATARPSGTARWLDARGTALAAHHHIRLDRANDIARLARSIGGASLGLALSGGGARGFAHLGVIRALAESGLAVDLVGGTSMGAVLGGLCALGHDVPAIIDLMHAGHRSAEPLRDLTVPIVSLLRGDSLAKPLKLLFGDTQIEDFWIPYFCVSANLSRAEVVVHSRGPAWRWLLASSSAPGVVPPVVHRGDLLVDGGVLNNLPADIVRERCRGAVVAVDVGARVDLCIDADDSRAERSGWPHLVRALNPLDNSRPFPNIIRILLRMATLGSTHDQDAMRDVADLYLHPPVEAVDMMDWGTIEPVVEIGYRYARGEIAAWMTSDRHVTATHAAVRHTATWAL